MPDAEPSLTVENAVHAAQTWLQRVGAPADALAVITVWPAASAGIWQPGQASVFKVPADDTTDELLEAVSPIVSEVLTSRLTAPQRDAVVQTVLRGARLQALVAPSLDGLVVRLATDSEAIEVARVELIGRDD